MTGHGGAAASRLEGRLEPLATSDAAYGALIAFHPNGATWATAHNGEVQVWKGTQPAYAVSLDQADQLVFGPKGRFLYASPELIDLRKREEVELPFDLSRAFKAKMVPSYEVLGSAFEANGSRLIFGAAFRPTGGPSASEPDGAAVEILVIHGRRRKVLKRLWRGDEGEYSVFGVHPRFLAAAHVDVRVWSARSLKPVAHLKDSAHKVWALAFSRDGAHLASVDADGLATLWATDSFGTHARWQAHQGDAWSLAFHPQLPLVATGGADSLVKVWSLDRQPRLIATADLGEPVRGLAFRPDGDRLVAAVRDSGGP